MAEEAEEAERLRRDADSGAGLRVEDLRFAYPSGFELRVRELEVAAGERLALLGRSGSGKSTLLDLLAGVRVPAEGSVSLGGTRVSALGERERRRFRLARVGFVFQDFGLLEHLSAEENALLPYLVEPALGILAEARGRLAELAAATGIEALLGRRPAQLSQGERQRVALCRALVTRPDFVLADEPTGNLDPHTARRALDRILEEVARRGATLVLVTHDRALLSDFDRTVDLEELA